MLSKIIVETLKDINQHLKEIEVEKSEKELEDKGIYRNSAGKLSVGKIWTEIN
jgi:hypothetical protein